MANVPLSLNYIGYLNETLMSYKKTVELVDKYDAAETNLAILQESVEERRNAFRGKNFVIACIAAFVPFVTTAFILRIIWPSWTIIFLAASIVLALGLSFVVKLLYENYVLPVYEEKVNTELIKVNAIKTKTYSDIISNKKIMDELKIGLNSGCQFPLAVFIMLEAAKRGETNNYKTGGVTFLENYESLGRTKGTKTEEALNLRNQIEQEREESDNKEALLIDIINRNAKMD